MKEENSNFTRLIIIVFLSFIASIFMIIFTIPKAHALEIVSPNNTLTINNNNYYGYNVPTRLSNGSFPESYFIYGSTQYNGDSTMRTITSLPYYYKDYSDFTQVGNGALIDYANGHNIDLNSFHNVRTDRIVIQSSGNADKLNRVSFGFRVGAQNNTSEMLSNGGYINYNNNYSFTFDVLLYDLVGNLGSYVSQSNPSVSDNSSGFILNGSNGTNLVICSGPSEESTTPTVSNTNCYLKGRNDGITFDIIYSDSHVQFIKIHIPFNEYIQSGFTKYWSALSGTLDYYNRSNFASNNFFGPAFNVYNDSLGSVVMYVSEPYDITMWTQNPTEYCQTTCWTQDDTNKNNDKIYSDSQFTISFMEKINQLLDRNYGFVGIINLTYNFIKDILNSSLSNTCNELSIPILSTSIKIPCASSFWGRNDVSTFESFYSMLWLGLVSYLLGWKIYKDLLDLLNPYSVRIKGSEVDSL